MLGGAAVLALPVLMPSTALRDRTRADLRVFTDWLARERVDGFIGEFGWPAGPDADAWNALADDWFNQADAAGLWTTAWATGEWWRTSYPLAIYEERTIGEGVGYARPQATVLERHLTTDRYRRGINVAGGAFSAPDILSTSPFSQQNPGRYDEQYHFDGQETFDYLASRGLTLVRIEFRWERIQPRLGEPLDPAELGRLRDVVARADRAGLGVILDVHNFGAYYRAENGRGVRRTIGTNALPTAQFADLWTRLSREFRSTDNVVAYGLMNEPVLMTGGFTPASNVATFDGPSGRWTGATVREDSAGRDGNALRVDLPALGNGYGGLSVTGDGLSLSGPSVGLWVYLPEGAPAIVQAAITAPGDPRLPSDGSLLIPGEWTLVTQRSDRLRGASSLTLHLTAKDATTPFYVLIDDVANGSGATPAEVWEEASRAAVRAIRANGDDTLIMVAGYHWSQVATWTYYHPKAWIDDPNIRYEAHHYWDADRGSTYGSYADESREAAR